MKKGYFIFSFVLFSFLLLPISVDAAVQCDYKINSSSLSGIKEATVSCEFSYRTNAFTSFFLGDLDYSCKYNETGTTKKKKVTIMDANTDARSGFNLTEHIKNNNSCPKYLYINPKGLYAYAVNSNDNIKKMEDYALKIYQENGRLQQISINCKIHKFNRGIVVVIKIIWIKF